MKEIDVSNMLAQLRVNAALASGDVSAATQPGNSAGMGSFADLLQQSIDKVNELQQHSGDMGKAFEQGDPNISLAEVMIAKEKAGVAFQSVLQVRNKLMAAYQDIMSMHV